MKTPLKVLSGIISILISINAYTQTTISDDIFPEDWLGTYKGKMYIMKQGKGITDSLDIVFELLPDDTNRWIYRMTYKGTKYAEIIKDYYLIKPDSLAEGSFLLNEKDGIIIAQTLIGNTFYSNFTVAGNFLSSTMRKTGNLIEFEVLSSKKKESLTTKNKAKPGQIVFEVKSYPPYATQRAVLKKE